jgi:hypothetical protein
MNRLPVIETIRAAYAFTVQHLGSIIGLIWLPMVIVSVAGFFTLQNFLGAAIDFQGGSNPAALGPAALMMLAYLVVSLLLYAVMYSGVVQLALGTRPGGTVMHFALGAEEWRLFRALLALMGVAVMLLLAAMLTVMVASLALALAGVRPSTAQSGFLMMLAFYGVLGVVLPRFLVPLPAIAVAETGPALRRAWALSAGNYAGLLAIAIAAFVPGILVMQIAEALVPGGGAIAAGASEQAQTIALLQQQRAALPIASGVAFLVAPLTVGLVSGASVAIWRALSGSAAAPMVEDR